MAQHPTEETINITRKFLGGELGAPGQAPGGAGGIEAPQPGVPPTSRLPLRAAPIAGQRAFGQQGAARRPGGGGIEAPRPRNAGQPLSNRFLNQPGPVDFARTSQGQDVLRRIIGGARRRL